MPSKKPALSAQQVRDWVDRNSFDASTAGVIGIEAEWFVVDPADPGNAPDPSLVRRLVGGETPLPMRSRVSFEPGGQVELSTQPYPDLTSAMSSLAVDRASIEARLAEGGLGIASIGMWPYEDRPRVLFDPRYDAMEACFDSYNDAGRRMMRMTAALQINVDIPGDLDRTWQLLHKVGPILLAAFANSPFALSQPSGWMSTREATWRSMEPSRTGPAFQTGDARGDWFDYAMNAQVMLIRVSPERSLPVTWPLSFARWLDEGTEQGFPTIEDFEYHITTLFPPVRPRGWLEIRMIDCLPHDLAPIAAAVCAAIVHEPDVIAEATSHLPEVGWEHAAKHGVSDPNIAAAASTLFRSAMPAIEVLGDRASADAVGAFIERFLDRGRCPASDLMDSFESEGRMLGVTRAMESQWT